MPFRLQPTVLALLLAMTLPALAALEEDLETIRKKYRLPALHAALFTTEGVVESAAVGVRKANDPTPVTPHDLWHIGSDAKAMTAMLVGTFVSEGKLNWSDKAASFFPEWREAIAPALREITIGDLLSHRTGLTENLPWRRLAAIGSVPQQRLESARLALTAPPAYAGNDFHYSNLNYVVVAAILEKVTGLTWEELIAKRLFAPLKITTAGFGGSGTPGKIDQPFGHFADGTPVPVNGPEVDNALVMAPAGGVHLSADDWAKFLIDQLRGADGLTATFPASLYEAVQAPHPDTKADYGYGWTIAQRPWAGGKALTHSGTNTLNYAVCWLAPTRRFGVFVCTNRGGEAAFKACDEVASLLIQRHLKNAAK